MATTRGVSVTARPAEHPPADGQRAALLAAASRLLAEEGPEALTVRRIAAEAGVSTMGVYSRFGGKDGVLDALFREGFERLLAELGEQPPGADPVADLAAACRAYRRFAVAHATHYALMFQGAVPGFEPTDESRAVALASYQVLVDRVRRGLAAGVFAPVASAERLAYAVWATCHGAVTLELLGLLPEHAGPRGYARAVGVVVAGLSAVAPPR